MMNEVCKAPGQVWEYLSGKGECSVSKIKKETKMPDSLIYIGLGWLAKDIRGFNAKSSAIFSH